MEEEDGKSLVITRPIRQGVFPSAMPCVCPTRRSRAGAGRSRDRAGPGRWAKEHF